MKHVSRDVNVPVYQVQCMIAVIAFLLTPVSVFFKLLSFSLVGDNMQ